MSNVALHINEFVHRAQKFQFCRQDWIGISVVVLLMGFLCLKGLGNKTNL